jgi:hypothetical protein
MKLQNQTIRLSNSAADDSTVVKRTALTLFRVVRAAVDHSKVFPSIMQQAADDIRTAWEESSRPNA